MPFNSLGELALETGIPEIELWRYALHTERFYRRFFLQKKSGGSRLITAPNKNLKAVQRWISKNILSAVPFHFIATGYKRGCSIVDNASPHANKDFVLNVDIENFFGTIDEARVLNVFIGLGYSPAIAKALSRLTTCRGTLPQGAPSSPLLANLICRPLDHKLHNLCASSGWTCTRYCDDISVSGYGSHKEVKAKITSIIESEGFRLNNRKVRLVTKLGRQMVTGLVVNQFPNLSRTRRRNLRAALHRASLEPEQYRDKAQQLQGQISFLEMVRPDDPSLPKYKAMLAKLQEAWQ
ncbi:MAG TPA: retron St85 family RNA-directed DNA polymerase [Candidatus Obscuribacterales bacterium]